MASNSTDPSTIIADDDEYHVRYEDEEDDERTIEEEEQFESDDEQNELDDLQASANMPLDELLKMYGQHTPSINKISQEKNESNSSSSADEDNKNDCRHQFHHLLQVNGQLLRDEDDDDDTDDSFEPEIVKMINVGDEYQAKVELQAEFDSENGRCDDREVPVDELLWSPSSVNNENIDEYIKKIRNEYPSTDDEISLQTLFNCQMNIELAFVKFRQLSVKTIYSYPEWSSNEIEQFEQGLREYGKNFFKISVFKCPNRNVREIIHYYYQWKKSERYQLYMEEQQRLTAITSVTDMIEKLIEEQEQQLCTAVSVINSTNSSSVLSNDLKRNSPNSSISIVTIHQQETTTKRSFDQIDNDTEPSAKKHLLNTNNSSTATIV